MTRQEFVCDDHYCEFQVTMYPAPTCDPTHRRDHVRDFYLHLDMWDGPERIGERLIEVTRHAPLGITPEPGLLEAELVEQRDELVAQALEQVDCIRDARTLEREAAKRVQEFLKKPV